MGSFRLFRSKKIAPGVRFNLTKSGGGLSLGSKFFRVSKHTTGSSTRSVSLPGTGFQWRDQRKNPPGATPRQQTSPRTRTRPNGMSVSRQPQHIHPSLTAMLAANKDETVTPASLRAVHVAAGNADLWQLLRLHERLIHDPDARDATLITAALLAVDGHQPHVVAARLDTYAPDLNVGSMEGLISGQVAVPLTPGIEIVLTANTAVMYAVVYTLNRGSFYTQVTELLQRLDPQDDDAALFAVELARAFNGLGRFATAKETLAPVIRRIRFDRLIRAAALEQRCVSNMGLAERTAAKRDLARLADLSPDFPTIARLQLLVG